MTVWFCCMMAQLTIIRDGSKTTSAATPGLHFFIIDEISEKEEEDWQNECFQNRDGFHI